MHVVAEIIHIQIQVGSTMLINYINEKYQLSELKIRNSFKKADMHLRSSGGKSFLHPINSEPIILQQHR